MRALGPQPCHFLCRALLWRPFCRPSSEDATADYECAHDCPENPKLHLWHCGVLRRPTPLRAIIRRSAYQVLRESSGNLAMFAAIRFRRCPALGHRGACAVDQACRDPRDRRGAGGWRRTRANLARQTMDAVKDVVGFVAVLI